MPTATTPTPCECCGTCNPATLECRVRGGTAELCGFSEFADASVPPKKYRRKDFTDNNYYRCVYSDGSCTTPTGSDTVERTGYCVYDADDCSFDGSNSVQRTLSNPSSGVCAPPVTQISITNTCPGTFTATAGLSVTNTKTTNTRGTDGTCNGNARFFGSQVQTLSVEDTEADAIARLQDSTSWGSWIESGAGGCTGTPPSCCLARYQERVSGFTFVYQEAQARVKQTGLTPSTGYSVRIEFYRRPYGSGTYALYQTMIVAATTDGSGNLETAPVDVPNDPDFETYAFAGCVTEF